MGSSGSNGRVERAIQSVQDQVRVMRVALQDRWKVDVSHRHAVFPWMLEYAAHLLNRYEVGRDGRTAYERLKAKKAKPLGMEFGELVQWRTRPNRGRCSWEAGLGVGPRCLSRSQGEDGGDRDRGEIRNLQSEDCQEDVDRGSLEPEGHGAGHRRTVEDEGGRRQGRRGEVREVAGT